MMTQAAKRRVGTLGVTTSDSGFSKGRWRPQAGAQSEIAHLGLIAQTRRT